MKTKARVYHTIKNNEIVIYIALPQSDLKLSKYKIGDFYVDREKYNIGYLNVINNKTKKWSQCSLNWVETVNMDKLPEFLNSRKNTADKIIACTHEMIDYSPYPLSNDDCDKTIKPVPEDFKQLYIATLNNHKTIKEVMISITKKSLKILEILEVL